MLTLKFGNNELGVAHKLAVTVAGEAPETIERWQVELLVEEPTPTLLEHTLQALRDAHDTQGPISLLHDGSVVRARAVGDCRVGPTLANVTEHDAAPGEAHGQRRVTLEFSATLQDANAAVQSHVASVRSIQPAAQPAQVVTEGRIVLRGGEDPADHETLLPDVAEGFRRIRQTTTRDATVPSLVYETLDEQVFRALPGGVDDGHYVVCDSIGREGRPLRTISGFFVGASAKARALELRAGDDRLIAQRVDENPFTRRVDFEFVEWTDGSQSVAALETLSFTTTRRVIDHPLLDDALPAYRQQIGVPQTEIVQEGSAVGAGRHPSPPAPRFNADLIERRVQYSLPHPELPADQRWVTTWRYVSRGRGPIHGEV
ncbi:MAG: hypothetical protein KDB68_09120 [Planctomycetes bacterium]|nr:hypothetical protein [Planctomycetota bacterium]